MTDNDLERYVSMGVSCKNRREVRITIQSIVDDVSLKIMKWIISKKIQDVDDPIRLYSHYLSYLNKDEQRSSTQIQSE